jgi:phage terminase small subunit
VGFDVKAQLEKFCQLVAAGSSYTRAAVESGYANDRASASRRARRPEVMARIQEIRDSLPPIIVAEPEPEIVPLSVAHNGQSQPKDRIREFEKIRDEALARGHTSAAATAQRDLTKAERTVVTEKQLLAGDLQGIARQLLHELRLMKAEKASPEQVVRRKLGIPLETWLGWGLPANDGPLSPVLD